MVGSMLVLLLVVVVFVVLRDLNRVGPEAPADSVDYRQSAEFAEESGFEVSTPDRLPNGWRATSVEFAPEPLHWHLGLLTEDAEYVGLEQAKAPVRSMVMKYVDEQTTKTADVTIDGKRWTSWGDGQGDVALARRDGALTTLVVGPVEQEVLVDYVKSLT